MNTKEFMWSVLAVLAAIAIAKLISLESKVPTVI